MSERVAEGDMNERTNPHVSTSQQIPARFSRPVIDSNGQTVENPKVLAKYIKAEIGSKSTEQFGIGGGYSLVIRGESLAGREQWLELRPNIPERLNVNRAKEIWPTRITTFLLISI